MMIREDWEKWNLISKWGEFMEAELTKQERNEINE